VEQEYAPGGLVPPAPTRAELSARVVFVPLGFGPRVAADLARRSVLDGVEAYVAVAAEEDEAGPRPESPAPDEGHQGGTGGGQWGA
jgi:hypothetical protein